VKACDTNRNGKLDKEERAQILKEYDLNRNGKLDKNEKRTLARAVTEKQKVKDEVAARGNNQNEKLLYPPIKYTLKDWIPVKRTTEKIVRVDQTVIKDKHGSWKFDFYRNYAYKCGLSGNYTFVVIEPRNAPGKKAPLWVYFHGGGSGYFEKNGRYIALRWQNKDTYNHEETFETLRKINRGHPAFENGCFVDDDTTLTRRVKEGYRLLVLGYGDHDRYSGKGTPYPNNPKGGEVNGLQASMSAVEYTVAHYPTTYVFAHGTSAGSVGAYALGFAFAQEGITLTGIVMDSCIVTPRQTPIAIAMLKNNSKIIPPDVLEMVERENKDEWLGAYRGAIEKIGVMIDPHYPFYPEAAVKTGFKSVPMLIIAGTKDPFFGGTIPSIAQAKAAGLGNVEWMWDGLRKAIEKQKDSPHKLLIVNTGHVPTVKTPGHPVHDEVDKFIRRAISFSKSYPFTKNLKSDKIKKNEPILPWFVGLHIRQLLNILISSNHAVHNTVNSFWDTDPVNRFK